MSEWQDISTAPKDGTLVLVCMAGHPDIVTVAQWDRGFFVEHSHRYWIAEWTHWMPLPSPPPTPIKDQ